MGAPLRDIQLCSGPATRCGPILDSQHTIGSCRLTFALPSPDLGLLRDYGPVSRLWTLPSLLNSRASPPHKPQSRAEPARVDCLDAEMDALRGADRSRAVGAGIAGGRAARGSLCTAHSVQGDGT